MSAHWVFVIADLTGSEIADLTGARDRKISYKVDGPATVSWTTTGTDPGALAAEELLTDLIVYRDGIKMFRGRIGATSDSISADGHTVTWSAVDYRGMLSRRVIWPGSTLTYTGQDQRAIAWDLIRDTQATAGGNMGITDGSASTGRLRDRTYEPGKNVGEAIDQLATVIDGFDWDISPELQFRLWYPARGGSVDWAAVWGDTVATIDRTVDPSIYATDLYATGAETLTPITRSVAGGRDAGRFEMVASWPDVTMSGTLAEAASAALLDAQTVRPAYRLGLRRGAWSPSEAWLGDTHRIVCRSGRLDVDTTGRIVAIEIALDGDGGEDVTVTADRRPVTLVDRLLGVSSRLGTLERR